MPIVQEQSWLAQLAANLRLSLLHRSDGCV